MTPTQARVLDRTFTSPTAGEPGAGPGPGDGPRWGMGQLPGRHLAAAALAVIRREWLAVLFGLSALFAGITALITAQPPERLWGELAAVTYTVAAVVALLARRRGATERGATVAVLISLAGALFAPLIWMAVSGMAQPEVQVIIRSAEMLVHTGTPYASPAALAATHNWMAYNPYLPALIAFGIPRTLAGGLLTDPRIWFGVAFVITFGAALRVAGVRRATWWTVLVTASPVVALPIAVGGDDLPVLGLVCLGLALADRVTPGRWRWAVAAGAALGLAAAMKSTAWPALAVALILIVHRGGWRAVGGFTLAVAGLVLATDGPVVAVDPAATAVNTIMYPLGLTKAVSPAASQLPGHLLASAGSWGHSAALALMVLAGAGVAASLIIRPPKDAQAAGWRLVLGLTLLFGLAPASRVGYFVYPAGLAAWLLLLRTVKAKRADGPAGPALARSVNPVPAFGRQAVANIHDRLKLAAARLDHGS
jgi:Glycosyltransferase family 87